MHGNVWRTWGNKDNKTGLMTGFTGQLERKEADIGGRRFFLVLNIFHNTNLVLNNSKQRLLPLGTIIFMSIDRIPYLDYLSMTIPSKIAFILRSPPISYVKSFIRRFHVENVH